LPVQITRRLIEAYLDCKYKAIFCLGGIEAIPMTLKSSRRNFKGHIERGPLTF